MDKNTIIGIVLMTLLAIGYFYFMPKPEPQEPAQTESNINPDGKLPGDQKQVESILKEDLIPETQPEPATALKDDSLQHAELFDLFSDWSAVAEGEDRIVKVKTGKFKFNFRTKGGFIESAYLNNYKTYDSLPLPIIAPNPDNQYFLEFVYKNRPIRTDQLYFVPSADSIVVSGKDSARLVMRAEIGDGKFIEQIYTFRGNKYDVRYDIRMEGFGDQLKNSFLEMTRVSHLPRTEKSIPNLRQKSTIAYAQGTEVSKLSYSDKPQEKFVQSSVNWFSFKSQFFTTAWIAKEPFRTGNLNVFTPESETVNKVMQASMYVDVNKKGPTLKSYTLFMGPNEYYTLSSYKVKLQKQMDLGWGPLSYINIGTVYVFKFMERYISNYGLIIFIFAVLVKMLVFPMTYKSYVSMAKLRVVNEQPMMKDLDAKFKDDPQKLQVEKMAMYRKMGVSPFGGCLPMILQYPILISMFFFFPQSVELRQQSFLWAHDLSTYDSIWDLGFTIPMYGDHISLFTILMAISIYIYTYYNQKSQPSVNNQMKYISYFMPLIFIVFLNNYASGLSWYYFAANLISIIQTTGIRYFLDDEKLLSQLEEARKKKGGKNDKAKGKGRIEQWLERQQQKQRELSQAQRQQGKGKPSKKK